MSPQIQRPSRFGGAILRTSWKKHLLLLFAILLAVACSANSSSNGDGAGTGDGDGDGNNSNSAGAPGTIDTLDPPPIDVELTIVPEDPLLELLPGEPVPTVSFEVLADGVPVTTGEWRTDRAELGVIDSSTGLFTPSGEAGGLANVRVLVGDRSVATTVQIKLTTTENGGDEGIPTGVGGEGNGPAVDEPTVEILDTATPTDGGPELLYPYDRTVFPLGVLPPLLMWSEAPASVEAIRISLSSDYVDYKGYFGRPSALDANADFVRHPITEDAWNVAGLSTAGSDLAVEIRLLAGGQVYEISQTWPIAPGKLIGTVYYNSYGSKKVDQEGHGNGAVILSISPQAKDAELILGFDSPDNSGCRACHTVRSDGGALLANFGGESGAKSTLLDIATGVATPYDESLERKLSWMALHKDGELGLGNSTATADLFGEGETDLYDVATGAVVESTGLNDFVTQAGLPAFSHDGTQAAFTFVAGPGNAEIGSGLPTKLVVMDFSAEDRAFSNPRLLFDHPTHTPGWVSFSPTGDHVVFSITTKISAGRFATESGNQAEIWIADVKTGDSWRLDTINGLRGGESYLPKSGLFHQEDENLNYEPTTSPIVSGGKVWIVFTSRRLYGNTNDEDDPWHRHPARTGTHPKKLWVAALDLDPKKDEDGSHPAFLLPGQELPAINARGFWVNSPCLDDGETCDVGVDCCGGVCVTQDDGEAVCGDGEGECRMEHDRCSVTAECCNEGDGPQLECIGGSCTRRVVR